ncbi:MAG: class I SAM-dependent RNA methyltransferase [Bacteroidota bacterium]|jgi:putative N6-adenine-specific DNA methylase
MSENIRFIAKTITGLEEVLAKELQRLGARDVEQLYRAVAFTGDKGFMYKANFSLHTALRILVPITSFEVSDEQSLYDAIKKISWEDYLDARDSLAIDTVLSTKLFNHSQFISQKAKDAIADRFREKFQVRPDVDLKNPTLRINLHINENICNVSLDSSGESLHKRGYREQTNLAPMNEVLAAGLVKLSGWQKHQPLIDPMCGSGTILIEAALIAANIPPGYYREHFGFMKWKKFMPFEEELWKTITDGIISRIDASDIEIIGGELSHHVARKAKENVKLARVEDMVSIRECDMRDFDPPARKGVVIVNPPYGERMDKDDLTELYKSIGDTFKKRFSGYDCWLITSNKEALKNLGLRTSRRIPVFNGPLECRFVKYEMYMGSKKHIAE